ncbi:PPC domain-containing DNA-binding protein [Zoogloea sp.]|uniref:PPC domain-containing DNA-binding protein n=1 Tax=Zoogloea sp. TaxID=49181 RepID=UPI0035B158F6
MDVQPIRLTPGQDLRRALECALFAEGGSAAFVLAGIGSLSGAHLRLAGAGELRAVDGDIELLSLSGSIAANGSHLHGTVATASGAVIGGHLGYGCVVRTTAEILLMRLPGWDFQREPDLQTGYAELVVRQRASGLD